MLQVGTPGLDPDAGPRSSRSPELKTVEGGRGLRDVGGTEAPDTGGGRSESEGRGRRDVLTRCPRWGGRGPETLGDSPSNRTLGSLVGVGGSGSRPTFTLRLLELALTQPPPTESWGRGQRIHHRFGDDPRTSKPVLGFRRPDVSLPIRHMYGQVDSVCT